MINLIDFALYLVVYKMFERFNNILCVNGGKGKLLDKMIIVVDFK